MNEIYLGKEQLQEGTPPHSLNRKPPEQVATPSQPPSVKPEKKINPPPGKKGTPPPPLPRKPPTPKKP